MKTYLFTIAHDNGVFTLKTFSLSIVSALEQVLSSERCPETAIKTIQIIEEKAAQYL
jgi:hypothetical protein